MDSDPVGFPAKRVSLRIARIGGGWDRSCYSNTSGRLKSHAAAVVNGWMMDIKIPETLADFNAAGAEYLPGHLGMTFSKVEAQEVAAHLDLRKQLRAWNGYLHAGTIVTLADTCCGYGTVRSLPSGAVGFTTVELKSNFFASARDGIVVCTARPLHQGRTTQVWDAQVAIEGADKPIAQFRCTQLILWPKA